MKPVLLFLWLALGFLHEGTTQVQWDDGAGLAAVQDCVSGPGLEGLRDGALGSFDLAGFELITCLEVRNDRAVSRQEIASSGIPLPREMGILQTGDLVILGPGLERISAQFDVLSRWGGARDAPALPARWLQVSFPVRVNANSVTRFAFGRTPQAAAADPHPARIERAGNRYRVDNGTARFILDPENPALFDEITLALDPDCGPPTDECPQISVYSHQPGAGPRLVVNGLALDTSQPGAVMVDGGGFQIVEDGPVKVVATLKGHFSDVQSSTLCITGGVSYERFGFTVVATFWRGSPDVRLQYHFRNECSDALSGPWTDEAVSISEVSWVFPLLMQPISVYFSGAGPIRESREDLLSITRVEQQKGAGTPWRRRSQVLRGGLTVHSGETLEEPFLAVESGEVLAAVQVPWMRYREPQALELEGSVLRLLFVSQETVLGEGKGLWNFAKLSLRATATNEPAGLTDLEDLRRASSLELERGLLVRAPLDHLNRSRLFPGAGADRPSSIRDSYLQLLDDLHRETVAPGGQWDRAKTFGSQLWPDTQADLYQIDNPTPVENSGAMNYWNPSGAELLEFLRTGNPAWVWDFALPQSWLQAFTAYLNTGAQDHGNRSGLAVTSGGAGEGHWHRSAFGSDDYSYNQGLHLAYALRPNPVLRDRFAQAGRTVVDRYSIPQHLEDQRERFVNQVDLTRQVLQHFEMLANCAEFVPGDQGLECLGRLGEVVEELARDNLRAGILCQGDVPSTTSCDQPQQFMQSAMMFPFLSRIYRSYGDSGGALRRALTEGPLAYLRWGMARHADGSIDVASDWAALLSCTLRSGGTEVESCSWVANSDGLGLLRPNKPHTAALLLQAHELSPSLRLCGITRSALDDPGLTEGWQEFLANQSGWWKGAAQMMQGMIFGVGLYDTCRDPTGWRQPRGSP